MVFFTPPKNMLGIAKFDSSIAHLKFLYRGKIKAQVVYVTFIHFIIPAIFILAFLGSMTTS
jgi:hypothetical protein